jgi:hypothetical protein
MTREGHVFVRPAADSERAFPTSGPDGQITRSHLVWNRAHPDDVVQPGEEVHHRNRDPADDRLENLQKFPSHAAHMAAHRGDPHPGRRGPRPHLRKSWCVHGHRLDEENTYIAPDGHRSCRRCRSERWIARRKRPDGSTVQAKLTPVQVEEIKARYAAGGVTQAQLGREYGVSAVQISRIVTGARWGRVGWRRAQREKAAS